MAEITADTSFYPKAPAQKGLLDQVQQYGAIEQQQLNIDKSKLEMAITHQGQMLEMLNAVPKDATREDLKKWGQSVVNMKLSNPRQYAEFMTNMPAATGDAAKDAEALRNYRATLEQRAMGTLNAMKWKYGVPFDRVSNQSTTPMIADPREGTERRVGSPIAVQPTPDSEYINPVTKERERYGQRGETIPPGAQPDPKGAPGSYIDPGLQPIQPKPVPTQSFKRPGLGAAVEAPPEGPITDPRIKGKSNNFAGGGTVLGATVENAPVDFNSRFGAPSNRIVQRAPGEADAETITGQQSGKMLASARERAANFTQEMLPLTEALAAVKKLGTQGTGPGTESLNYVKSFIKSNLPGLDETAFESVTDFDKAKKYLVQIAKSAANTTTNDQLAAAFAGNPNVGISNAATQDVLASIIALKKLDLAKTKAFEKANLPDSQAAKFSSKWDNDIDPRAFAISDMSPEAIVKLNNRLKGKEREKFNRSVQIARELGL